MKFGRQVQNYIGTKTANINVKKAAYNADVVLKRRGKLLIFTLTSQH